MMEITTQDSIMKHQVLFLTLFAAALMVGCDKPQTTSQQTDDVREKTAAAAQAVKEQDYTYAQKAEYTEKMKTQLAEINKDLELLEAKIEKSSEAVRVEATPKLQALRQQAAKLNTHIDETQNATESTWESVKTTSRKAYDELKDGFTQARQWVSEKIAP